MDIEKASELSIYNRPRIKAGEVCGCYFCLTVFDGGEIHEWMDDGKTACCPRCDVDAVLPGVDDIDALTAAHERWFTSLVKCE